MRYSSVLTLVAASLAFADDPPPAPPQPQPTLTKATALLWNLDWQGVAGRTYFVQTSLDLVTWEYEPTMAFGAGLWNTQVGSNHDKYFVRLAYVDEPSVTTPEQAENADFDGDGVSNIDEITRLMTNPLAFSTNGGPLGDGAQDWDGDGISNAEELALGLDPGVDNTTPAAGAAATDYAYDDTHRLLSATAPLSASAYVPDEEGNLQ